ncbi:MAG: hypothetical protein JXA67_11140 [Micromonosporaceae bacterium]|nr:hypothetical protein [Micromonosporaceae bacterium]
MTHNLVPTLAAVGILALAALGYAASCLFWPYTRCGRCEGTGKRSRKDGRVWRPCRTCKGSGRRLRVGRWLYNRIAERRREALR